MSSADAVRAVKLNLWGSDEVPEYSLAIDQGGGKRLSALVLSRKLAALAKEKKVRTVELDADGRAQLDRALAADAQLKNQLDVGTAIRATANGVVLKGMTLSADRPEPIVVLVDDKALPGSTAILQLDADGAIVGGFTITVGRPERIPPD